MRRVIVIAAVSALFVGVATIGSAASFTVTAAKLGGAAVTTPIMFPDSVSIENKAGQTLGRADNGDIITLVFSRLIDAPSLCSTFSNSLASQKVKVTWSIINGTGGANDTLAVTAYPAATCASGFAIGTIDLGSGGYNTSTSSDIDFPSDSTLTFGTTTSTLSVQLGGRKGGTQGIVASGNAATWTPDSAVTDRSGHNCGANLSKTSATVQF